MKCFFIDKKLCQIVIEDVVKFVKGATKEESKFVERLDDQDKKITK